jgi:hypothetical protein
VGAAFREAPEELRQELRLQQVTSHVNVDDKVDVEHEDDDVYVRDRGGEGAASGGSSRAGESKHITAST